MAASFLTVTPHRHRGGWGDRQLRLDIRSDDVRGRDVSRRRHAAGHAGNVRPFTPTQLGGTQASLASATDLPNCAADDLRFWPDGPISETGEHVFSVRIYNTRAPCVLGYPIVQLLDGRGRRLPVTFHAGGRYTTTAPPRSVVLPTGAEAVVVVAKYRCDLGPGILRRERRGWGGRRVRVTDRARTRCRDRSLALADPLLAE